MACFAPQLKVCAQLVAEAPRLNQQRCQSLSMAFYFVLLAMLDCVHPPSVQCREPLQHPPPHHSASSKRRSRKGYTSHHQISSRSLLHFRRHEDVAGSRVHLYYFHLTATHYLRAANLPYQANMLQLRREKRRNQEIVNCLQLMMHCLLLFWGVYLHARRSK